MTQTASAARWRFWAAAAVFFVLILWLLNDILLPFVVGMAVAYFLDPIVARLQRLGLWRTWATTTVTIFAVLLAVGVAMAILPPLFSEVQSLILKAPQYIVQAAARVQPLIEPLREKLGLPSLSLQDLQADATQWAGQVLAAVVLCGQWMEGNVLSPKLVGDRVGLHPVWIMVALLAGGSLFGFVGILIAVPTAAVIGVIVRHLLGRYRESGIYRGGDPA